ncbi:glycosyltransferase family 2 protein [Nitratireductor sp. XY-223]|uniref:glycosyltransferase family 2 protein n=1 Tax=Nitratireductor sp. XY-223 TaxID=2561926 RepID=UPI0010AAE44B|nr:glycosyltransferase family 2 protein [Nitratireductor sp. XY-223]
METRPTSGTASKRVTVISVCFNSSQILPEMLASLPDDVRVVIVDNGSEDIQRVRSLCARTSIRLIENGKNLGFGRACNIGARGVETEFLLFLNPDAKLQAGAIQALLKGADIHPEACAFNPIDLCNGRKRLLKRSSVLLPRRNWEVEGGSARDRRLPVLSGAALFVRRSAFEAVGGFDEQIFLYHEDDDISLRLKHQCGALLCLSDAIVSHARGQSSLRNAQTARQKAMYMGQSRVYATRKHGVPYAYAKASASGLLRVLSPINVLSARKRSENLGFLNGVWSARKPRAPVRQASPGNRALGGKIPNRFGWM